RRHPGLRVVRERDRLFRGRLEKIFLGQELRKAPRHQAQGRPDRAVFLPSLRRQRRATGKSEMSKPPRPWTGMAHGPIEEIDENLWGVVSAVPDFPKGTGMDRRMSIIRLGDGRLVFHNAVPLDDAALAKVNAWGKPSILIVPMHLHAIDAHAFQEKLGVAVYTSKTVVDKVRALVPVEGTLDEVPADPALRCEPLGGTRFA